MNEDSIHPLLRILLLPPNECVLRFTIRRWMAKNEIPTPVPRTCTGLTVGIRLMLLVVATSVEILLYGKSSTTRKDHNTSPRSRFIPQPTVELNTLVIDFRWCYSPQRALVQFVCSTCAHCLSQFNGSGSDLVPCQATSTTPTLLNQQQQRHQTALPHRDDFPWVPPYLICPASDFLVYLYPETSANTGRGVTTELVQNTRVVMIITTSVLSPKRANELEQVVFQVVSRRHGLRFSPAIQGGLRIGYVAITAHHQSLGTVSDD